jgi:hypothetical protein
MVSKGYLRAWADDRGAVEVLDRELGRTFVTGISNATVVSYAYNPSVLNRDLEGDYAAVENHGIRVISKLRSGESVLTSDELTHAVSFLDMHLNRGRYADQAAVRTPAAVLTIDGTVTHKSLNLGDRLLLSESIPDVVRLAPLGIEAWPWVVVPTPSPLATGDGAVLLFAAAEAHPEAVTTVIFPLSPTQLLVIGEQLDRPLPLNDLVYNRSRRWVVWTPGTLTVSPMAPLKRRPPE